MSTAASSAQLYPPALPLQTGIGVEAVVQFEGMPYERARSLLASFVANELGIVPTRLLVAPVRPAEELARQA